MAVCGAILNYGAAKVMSPGEAATTLAWAAAISEAIKLSWLAGFRVCLNRREILGAATLLGVGVLLHGYTMIAVLGSSAVGRDEVQSARQGKIDAHAQAEATVADAKARVASYEGVRSEATVQQDINRLLETPDTNGCKRPYGLPAKLACEQIGQLKSELVGARKADQAREDLIKAQAELKSAPHAPKSIDPQAAAMAAWLPLSAETIGRLLPLLPSMLLEFSPMGGMMLASILWDQGGEHDDSDERGILVRGVHQQARYSKKAKDDQRRSAGSAANDGSEHDDKRQTHHRLRELSREKAWGPPLDLPGLGKALARERSCRNC